VTPGEWSQFPNTAEELVDLGQDGLLIPHEGPMVGAIEFDKARLRELAREVASGSDANGAIPAAMKHQARYRDSAQEMSHIRIAQCLEHTLERSHAAPKCSRAFFLDMSSRSSRKAADCSGISPTTCGGWVTTSRSRATSRSGLSRRQSRSKCATRSAWTGASPDFMRLARICGLLVLRIRIPC
jgi:hypothetical protein